MKTNGNRISANRLIVVLILNCLLVWQDILYYENIIEGKQGNCFEFGIFSLNSIYFVVLFGVISVWILVADYREISGIDILFMYRFEKKRVYYKKRMLNQSLRVFVYVILSFVLRLAAAKIMGYRTDAPWYLLIEYQDYSAAGIIYLIAKLFVGVFGYLCSFAWLRETLGDLVNSTLLRIALPVIIPVIELAIYKSVRWKLLPYLPVGNTLLDYPFYSKEILSRGIYWISILSILYIIRVEFCQKRDYYE